MDMTINYSIQTTDNLVACDSAIWNGNTYFTSLNDGSCSGTSDYNNYYAGSGTGYFGITEGANSVYTDPQLDANYKLTSTSPGKDTGTSDVDSVLTDDYDGISRPQGAGWDIGAYEFNVFSIFSNGYLSGGEIH